MMMMQRSPFAATVFLVAGALATAPHAQTQSDETPTSTGSDRSPPSAW